MIRSMPINHAILRYYPKFGMKPFGDKNSLGFIPFVFAGRWPSKEVYYCWIITNILNVKKSKGWSMDIHLLLRTFLQVAELGNVTQAAERLNFTQPGVTGQIQALEEHFGVRLFDRLGKKIYITDAGRELLVRANELLTTYDKTYTALQAFSAKDTPIKLGASMTAVSYILPPILKEFQKCRTNTFVVVDISKTLAGAIKGVLENTYDLAIIHDNVQNSNLMQFVLSRQKLVWIVQRQLAAENNNSLDVRCYPFINHTNDCSFRTKYEAILGSNSVNSNVEYSNADAIKNAVINGLGASVLPYILVKPQLKNGTLVELNGPPLHFILSVVFHKSKVFSPAMRTLFDVLAKHTNLSSNLRDYLSTL